MESPTIQERFEALRQAYIRQNPVDMREDQQINDALAAWKADESYDSEGSKTRVNPRG